MNQELFVHHHATDLVYLGSALKQQNSSVAKKEGKWPSPEKKKKT